MYPRNSNYPPQQNIPFVSRKKNRLRGQIKHLCANSNTSIALVRRPPARDRIREREYIESYTVRSNYPPQQNRQSDGSKYKELPLGKAKTIIRAQYPENKITPRRVLPRFYQFSLNTGEIYRRMLYKRPNFGKYARTPVAPSRSFSGTAGRGKKGSRITRVSVNSKSHLLIISNCAQSGETMGPARTRCWAKVLNFHQENAKS